MSDTFVSLSLDPIYPAPSVSPPQIFCTWCAHLYAAPGRPEPYPSTRHGCPHCNGADAELFGVRVKGGQHEA